MLKKEKAKIVTIGEETYLYADGRPDIIQQADEYAKCGVNVLEEYKDRVFRVHGTNKLVLENLLGNIVPMGTIEEYQQKKEDHEAYVLSILAV